jgi:hypothetical protein
VTAWGYVWEDGGGGRVAGEAGEVAYGPLKDVGCTMVEDVSAAYGFKVHPHLA